MRVFTLLLLAATALAVPGSTETKSELVNCSTGIKPPKETKSNTKTNTKSNTKTNTNTKTPSTPPPSATSTKTCPPTPLPPLPPPAPILANTWGRGFIDPADFIEGDYINGSEYLSWAWALIYRPADDGTFCLTTYSEEGQAAMVAYIADTVDPTSAAIVAGTSNKVGAACVKGVDGSCVDFYTQWGNKTVVGHGRHCFACGDASHGPGV